MTQSITPPPIEQIYDLNRLSEAGYETTLSLDEAARLRLAEWVDVVSIERFEATIGLRRLAPGRFAYTAQFEADITQNCAVTLEPVYSKVVRDFSRTLHLVPHISSGFTTGGELSPGSGDDEVPEEIDSSHFDLAAPLLEELVLAIDPYPRAPGAAFEPLADEIDETDNPFAVLKSLKTR